MDNITITSLQMILQSAGYNNHKQLWQMETPNTTLQTIFNLHNGTYWSLQGVYKRVKELSNHDNLDLYFKGS